MKLTRNEQRALAEFAKPVGQRDYAKAHGHTIHALKRKGLIASDGKKPGRHLTAAGHAALTVPDVFADLFDKKATREPEARISEARISKKALALAARYAALTPEAGYADMNAAIVLAKALLRVTQQTSRKT